ncbi:hypothetical protein RBB75_16205 [Tunturibacter empetritectus]|uniref:Uncharacterized protein n=1 Tax=Tunturiibacter empetritectus TaxID=3069691 RepID=A0AAU7ZBD5_9BACT
MRNPSSFFSRPRTVLLLLSAILYLCFTPSSPAQTADPAPAVQGQEKGKTFSYRGYRFDIQEIEAIPEKPALLAAIQQQTDLVESTPLTEPTKQFLRGFTVHVSVGEGEHGGGGHFGQKGVFVSLRPQQDNRPILLHEFMHAFQNDRLPKGRQNPDVLRFYERAKTADLWPPQAYMLKNVGEFFAMTASTYLCGHADRPPFNRANIEQKQPRYAEWLASNVR